MADIQFRWAPQSVSLSALRTDYVRVPVQATTTSTGQPYDPRADTVQFAFLAVSAQPQATDWKAASWSATPTAQMPYMAECLVGPGGVITLVAGVYNIWAKATDNPEIDVEVVGTLTIT